MLRGLYFFHRKFLKISFVPLHNFRSRTAYASPMAGRTVCAHRRRVAQVNFTLELTYCNGVQVLGERVLVSRLSPYNVHKIKLFRK